jgi:Beta-galactosidase
MAGNLEVHGRTSWMTRSRVCAAFLGCLAVLISVGPGQSAEAGQAPDYAGLYIATWPLIDRRRAPDDAVYAVRNAAGVYIRLVWRTIEPSPGVYDWSTLDAEVDRALRAGKKISLSVITGGFQPAWLADRDVSTSTFVVGKGGSRRRCVTIRLGWPWDPDYQNAYVAVMKALSQHLRSRPGAYEAVRIVKLTGISQNTEELRLPAANEQQRWRGRTDPCRQSDAIRTWQEAGYRPDAIVEAWTRMAQGVDEAFPDKLLAQDVLQANDFPPINDKGEIIDRSAVTVKDQIIKNGIAHFSPRFAVQWDGLTAEGRIATTVKQAGEAGAVIGWQTNAFQGLEGAGCNADRSADAVPCDAAGYAAILQRGVAEGARYLEIWSSDAVRFPDALAAAATALAKPAHGR